MGLQEPVFVAFLLIALAGLAFWVWMIVDCVTNEPSTGNDKIVWIIIIVFAQIVGALIYYFVRHRRRVADAWHRDQRARLGLPEDHPL